MDIVSLYLIVAVVVMLAGAFICGYLQMDLFQDSTMFVLIMIAVAWPFSLVVAAMYLLWKIGDTITK
jgi:hypothetical protein